MASLRRYVEVWRLPGAPTLVVAGVLARFPIGMAPLALVLLVRGGTGSYAAAGVTSAGYGLANALTGPLVGRLADRRGPVGVLLATAVAYPAFVALTLLTVARHLPVPVLVATAALAGGSMAPLTATLRSVWSDLTAPETPAAHLRDPALALETTSFEVVFTVGPMLVGAVVAVATPTAAMALAGVLAGVGTATVALGRATRGWRPHPDRPHVRGFGPATAPGMPLLLSVVGLLTFSFGIIGVALAAFGVAHGGAKGGTVAGVLLGLWGVGSITGGVWFGTRHFQAPLPTQWRWTLSAVAAGMAALVVMPSVPLMAVALLLAGLPIAPALTVENGLVARVAPVGMVNEAYQWVATVGITTAAAGVSLGGVVVDAAGTRWAFTISAASAIAAAIAAGLPRSALRRTAEEATRIPA